MSAFNDPRLLSESSGAAAVGEGAPPAPKCSSCGYDRRGIPAGAPCPECGRTPEAVRRAAVSSLAWTDADLLRLRRALTSLSVGWLFLLGAWTAVLTHLLHGLPVAAMVSAGVVGGTLFALGAWFVSPPEEILGDEGRHGRRLHTAGRVMIVVASLLFLVVAITGVFGVQVGGLTGVEWLISTCYFMWVILRLLLVYPISLVARGTNDEAVGRRMSGLSWGILLLGPLGSYFAYNTIKLNLMICIGVLFLPIAYVILELIYGWSLWELRRSFAWTIRYQDDVAARNERLRRQVDEGKKRRKR